MPRLAPSNDRSSKKLIISNTHRTPFRGSDSPPLLSPSAIFSRVNSRAKVN